jgi:small subunit ribosomal protein S1
MEGRVDSRQAPIHDAEWWAGADEGYWRALVEQGEVAPETSPPADLQEAFFLSGLEPGLNLVPAARSAGGNGPGGEDDWQSALGAFERGDSFQLCISGANRGGLLVDWNGLQGFIPASHLVEMPHTQDPLARVSELAHRIGESVTVRMIEVDTEQKRLVFSERAARSQAGAPEAILSELSPGDVCQGMVTNLTTFGAFVDLGGIEGLIHISELSWDRVRHPGDVLQPGQAVEVHVLGVNPDEKRIALSLKRRRPDPWTDVASRYQVGDLITGSITNVVSFGAFVRVEEGLEGLIHISELAEGSFLHPRNVVHEGDHVRVRILRIDSDNHRMGLSLRQAHTWQESE